MTWSHVAIRWHGIECLEDAWENLEVQFDIAATEEEGFHIVSKKFDHNGWWVSKDTHI